MVDAMFESSFCHVYIVYYSNYFYHIHKNDYVYLHDSKIIIINCMIVRVINDKQSDSDDSGIM